MEERNEIRHKPVYTIGWLGLKSLYVLGIAFLLTLIAWGVDGIASARVRSGLLHSASYSLISDTIGYCFGVISITSISLMLVEVAFRKTINYIQYLLIAMALTLFYLLLLALAEKMAFGLSYTIVSAMTIGLIAWFIRGITHNTNAVALAAGLLAVEYGLLFVLINLGSMALLVGSLLLFALIALAMYFTLKLKVENDELVIK